MKTVLEVENLEKYYGSGDNQTRALAGISFKVRAGEYVGIMGASGSGKTTLLNCISTIDRPSAGQIVIDERDITRLSEKALAKFRRSSLGFVFQDFNLLDTLTAYENIALALTILRRPAAEIVQKVQQVADLLGISQVLNKFPYQMSGGQKQRVAVARAIITEPSLVLADEPTGALDSKSAKTLLESFERLAKNQNSAILMVTHDAVAASYCDRILFIRDGQLSHQLKRGSDSRPQFFNKILKVVKILGDASDDLA